MIHWCAFLLMIPAAVVAWAQTPASRHTVLLLWSGDAPGSEGKTGDEKVRMQQDDQIVSSVHRPSIMVYLPPKGKATGAAVIVAPVEATANSGLPTRVTAWPNGSASAAWPPSCSNTVWRANRALPTWAILCPDIQRAIRTVRARSSEWGVDPNRIGVIGSLPARNWRSKPDTLVIPVHGSNWADWKIPMPSRRLSGAAPDPV